MVEAAKAIQALTAAGFPRDEIHTMMSADTWHRVGPRAGSRDVAETASFGAEGERGKRWMFWGPLHGALPASDGESVSTHTLRLLLAFLLGISRSEVRRLERELDHGGIVVGVEADEAQRRRAEYLLWSGGVPDVFRNPAR